MSRRPSAGLHIISSAAHRFDQGAQHFPLLARQIDQRRANRARLVADQIDPRLDDRDRVARLAIAQRRKGKEEGVKDILHRRTISGAHSAIETLRQFGYEVEDRRGISGNTHAIETFGEEFVRRHAADIAEPIAQLSRDVAYQIHPASAVLETDEVGARIRQARNSIGIGYRIGTVIEYDAQARGIADRLNVSVNALLGRFRQIVREQEDASAPAFSTIAAVSTARGIP